MTRAHSPPVRLATAYHEAGHAVVAHYLHHPIKLVSVRPTEAWDGLTRFQRRLSARAAEDLSKGAPRLRAEELIEISLAGPMAQRRHRPSSWRSAHGGSDFAGAADLAFMICGSEASADAFFRWIEIRTDELLVFHWADVEAVARAVNLAEDLDSFAFKSVLARTRG